MKRASRFAVASNWQLLLTDMKIDVESVLKHANLPADTFVRKGASLTVEQYFHFWLAMEKVAGDRDLPLLLAEYLSVESFDPPIFACICSDNLNIALERLRYYKPLIGPLVLDITEKPDSTHMVISCYGISRELPIYLNLTELVFFTQLSRLATRHRVEPLRVGLPELPENLDKYEAYFGCRLEKSEHTFIEFRTEDANRPFLTGNSAMWEFFEAKLNRKLADLDQDASTTDRVRSVLLEQLPAGIVRWRQWHRKWQ
ncbi:transcriptional regulator [Vibrio ishigakensis]|uniref:Transcriptional regulator n=1 Tax=Vibrio ishigakensis TaxID=1481914 RepID=A0A0B8QPI2_9VIBR|nr:transcriptional regulator [Vibrio ishigakensis]